MKNFPQMPAGSRFVDGNMISGVKNGHDAFAEWSDFMKSIMDNATHKLAVEAGVGITGTAEAYGTGVYRFGSGLIKTEILIDITDLTSSTTDDDIIGADGAGVAHLGQITAARNGTIYKGLMTCLEIPATGDLSIALWAADTGTGVEDTSITAQTNQNELEQSQGDGTDWAAGDAIVIADGLPTADQYLYLVVDGSGSPGKYTSGKFLIEFWGFAV